MARTARVCHLITCHAPVVVLLLAAAVLTAESLNRTLGDAGHEHRRLHEIRSDHHGSVECAMMVLTVGRLNRVLGDAGDKHRRLHEIRSQPEGPSARPVNRAASLYGCVRLPGPRCDQRYRHHNGGAHIRPRRRCAPHPRPPPRLPRPPGYRSLRPLPSGCTPQQLAGACTLCSFGSPLWVC